MSDTAPPLPAATPVLTPAASVAADILAAAPRVADAAPAATPQTTLQDRGAVSDFPPDSLGRRFDPARFRLNRETGRPYINKLGHFQPLGGKRGPAKPTPATTPAAPAPEVIRKEEHGDAWSASERAKAATPAPAPQPTAEAAPAPAGPQLSATGGAKVAVRAVYFSAGRLTGEPVEARLTGGDHDNFVETVAAWFQQRGWVATGGLAVLLSFVGYALGVAEKPKTSAKVDAWLDRIFKKKPAAAEKPAPPAEAPAPASTASRFATDDLRTL